MEIELTGPVRHWRGPAPHHFVTVPPDESDEIAAVAARVTYGWGVIPVEGRIGDTRFTTSLFPKDGGYVVPLKLALRQAEGIEVGDVVTITLSINV